MPHSNQVREFVFTNTGIELIDVYVSAGRVLTGRSRAGAQHEAAQAGSARGAAGSAAKGKTR
jgi:circadian clock protein KaiC